MGAVADACTSAAANAGGGGVSAKKKNGFTMENRGLGTQEGGRKCDDGPPRWVWWGGTASYKVRALVRWVCFSAFMFGLAFTHLISCVCGKINV